MKRNVVRHGIATSFGIACISLLFAATPSVSAQNGEPIKIGFSMALTGRLLPTASRGFSEQKSGKRKPTPRAAFLIDR